MMKLVRVDWVDCEGDGVWLDKGEFTEWAEKPAQVFPSFGLLAFEAADHIVLCQTVSEQQVDGRLKIPRANIKRIRVIEETDVEL